MLTTFLREVFINSVGQFHIWWSSYDTQGIKDHLCGGQIVVLEDQDIKIYIWRTIPYVKWRSVKSMKISNKALCLMMVSILKSCVKTHQKKIKGSSEVSIVKFLIRSSLDHHVSCEWTSLEDSWRIGGTRTWISKRVWPLAHAP